MNEKNVLKILNLIKFFNSKAKIIIDANEGWSFQFLKKNIKKLESFNILFIEQPLKAGEQKKLKKVKTKIHEVDTLAISSQNGTGFDKFSAEILKFIQ